MVYVLWDNQKMILSSSGGKGMFCEMANFRSDSYLCRQASVSLRSLWFSSSTCCKSVHSWDFSISSSSFCSIRLIRQLAAYPRFLSVLRRCFIRTISSRVRPRIFNVRLRSRTEIETSSSSLMSGMGHGDRGA